ncbi:MAG: Rnase Y domain-containing protein, partial [Oligoflexia bacterium]|nr:Rnase Y domain-containing protein [Oligoflexia bacterium]
MDTIFISTLSIFVLGLFVGALFFLLYSMLTARKREQSLKKEVNLILNRAKSQASKIERTSKQKAKDWEVQETKRIEREMKLARENLKNQEYQLKKNQEKVNTEFQMKEDELKKISSELKQEKELLEVSHQQLENLKEKVRIEKEHSEKALERIAVMTKEEAQEQLKKLFEESVKKEIFKDLLKIEEDMKKNYEKKAKLLLAQAMARYSAEVTAERTI